MADFLSECNDQRVPPRDFMDVFCKRCRNQECSSAGWADDLFSYRVSTQVERVLHAPQADSRLPKYAQIVAADFKDMFREAMRLEIADQRGDWEIPAEIPILDGRDELAPSQTTQTVDDAVRSLAAARGQKEPEFPDPNKEVMIEVEDPTPEPIPEPEEPAPKPATSRPQVAIGTTPLGNVPRTEEGIMVGGGPLPTAMAPADPIDPWEPPLKDEIVPVGATVTLNKPNEEG